MNYEKYEEVARERVTSILIINYLNSCINHGK
jgi:hypothetical protein